MGTMKKYAEVTSLVTNYARRMTRLSNRIFGEPLRPSTTGKPHRVVELFSEKPVRARPEIVDYYPRHVQTYELMKHLRFYGLFRDEHRDFKEEMQRLRALRGKVPPKKGEGKRALKNK